MITSPTLTGRLYLVSAICGRLIAMLSAPDTSVSVFAAGLAMVVAVSDSSLP